MKKLVLGMMAASLMGFASCSNETDDSTQSVQYPVMNLITPHNGDPAFATKGAYTFFFNLTQGTASVSTKELKIDNVDHAFTTDTTTCFNGVYQGGQIIKLGDVKGYLDRNRDLPLTNTSFKITSLFYVPTVSTPGYPVSQFAYPNVIAQYSVGDWDVATFQTDASYYGETKTFFKDKEGNELSYINKEMLYRIVLDTDKKTAAAIIYNAKFAEQAPTLKGIVVENLTLTYVAGGYRVEGKNIVPKIIEGNTATPIDRFEFETFTFETVGRELVKADITYDVKGGYRGMFSGAYVIEKILEL